MDHRALHAALALCVLLSGCSLIGPAETQTREDRAESALADAREAANATETYRYEGTLHVQANADGRSQTVTADLTGRANVSSQRLATTTETRGQSLDAYLVGETVYQECSMGAFWGTRNVTTDGSWAGTAPLSRQLDLLGSGSLSYNGTETVDGENATLLVGEPTTEALTEYQERRSGSTVGDANVKNPEMRLRLDAETDRVVESHLTFDVTEGGNSATATLTSQFSGYGEPVSIEVPTAATDDPLSNGCPGA